MAGKKKRKGKRDEVNHPNHYNAGRIEVIEVIEDQNLDFHRGNAIKYILRAPHKGTEIKDYEKAIWYLRRRIALAKGNPPRPNEMPQERA